MLQLFTPLHKWEERERERTFFYKLMKNSILINIRSSYSIVASTRQAWRKFKKKIMNLKYKIFPVNKLLKNKKKETKSENDKQSDPL